VTITPIKPSQPSPSHPPSPSPSHSSAKSVSQAYTYVQKQSAALLSSWRYLHRAYPDGRQNENRRAGEDILGKRPRQRLLAADLLRAHKTIDRDRDRAVHVLRGAVFGQAHFAKGLADAHDGFEVADLRVWGSVSQDSYP